MGSLPDVTVEPGPRARARANRLLFIRATESDEAFARLVSDSVAPASSLSPRCEREAPRPDQDITQVAMSGAFGYTLEGGATGSLDWKHLRAVAKPAAPSA